jgi:hypothetical protein
VCIFLLFACNGTKPDISNIDLKVEIQRLDQDIFEAPVDELPGKYGLFFEYYTHDILGIGEYHDSAFLHNLQLFKTAPIVQRAQKDVKAQYPDLNELNRKFTQAFKYYRYYFPDRYIPRIFSYISGYNQSLILSDSVIGIGLDKYLGANYKLYNELSFAKYLSKNMDRKKILSDCISTWTGNEWTLDLKANNDLISKMLHEGKILYATKMILPDEADSLIFGFSSKQLSWCKNNEKNMWVHLIEHKLLFSTDHFKIIKLTEDAPNTSEFTAESPGKACNWLGYKIIAQYMKNNPQTLSELMNNNDYRKILDKSKYKP